LSVFVIFRDMFEEWAEDDRKQFQWNPNVCV